MSTSTDYGYKVQPKTTTESSGLSFNNGFVQLSMEEHETPRPWKESILSRSKTWRRRSTYALSAPRYRLSRRILVAVLLMILFVFVPAIVWFSRVKPPFTPRPTTCDDNDDLLSSPANSTVGSGIESLFTIDRTFGRQPFWLVKFIDFLWDLCVARGMQFIAGWVSYIALSGVMLRAMELSPIPYDTYMGLTFSGPNISAIYSVLKDLNRYQHKRTILLFVGVVICMTYVVALPTLITAASGYISTSESFATIPGTDQLIRSSEFSNAAIVVQPPSDNELYCIGEGDMTLQGLVNRATAQMTCCDPVNCSRQCASDLEGPYDWIECGCPTSGSTKVYTMEMLEYVETVWNGTQCTFKNNDTFIYPDKYVGNHTTYCNQSLEITIDNQTFDAWNPLSAGNYGETTYYCYNNRAYDWIAVSDSVQCLPATHNPQYEWGFSTVLSSIILIVHMIWATFMFAMWLEAEINGSLQREGGFRMSQVRGAFIVTEAATRTTGYDVGALISRSPEEVGRMLSRRNAAVGFEVLEKELPLIDARPHEET